MKPDMFDDISDADERQEAWCLYLQHGDEQVARDGAKSENDRTSSRRCSGPIRGGLRPIISDFAGYTIGGTSSDIMPDILDSFGVDTRSVEERENDWDWSDRLNSCLTLLTDKQRYVVARRYGLDGYEASTVPAIAADLGIREVNVRKHIRRAMDKMSKGTPDEQAEAEALRKEQKRQARLEYNRAWMAEKRRKQKVNAG